MATASLTFIGNATCLLRLGPFALLTDPNFLHRGERAHLGYGLSSKRLREPALSPAELPALDAVLLSHLHGDHWDHRAAEGLDSGLPVITTPHAAKRLRTTAHGGFTAARGLRTWESHTLVKDDWSLTVTSMPGKHAFGVLGALLPPVMGSMLELTAPGAATTTTTVYVSGDTLVFDGLTEIARRHPDITVGVLHLGGTTLPGGFVVTMDGDAGARCVEVVKPRAVVPVHFDDYGVMKSPRQDFLDAVSRRALDVDLRVVERGATVPLD